MTSIKVKHGETIRQITITTSPAWIDFTNQIRIAFGIPMAEPMSVTYTDAEGDVISLDTDQELTDALRAQQTRFEITTQNALPTYPPMEEIIGTSETTRQSDEPATNQAPPLPPYTHDDPSTITPTTSSSSALPEAFAKFASDLNTLVAGLVTEIRNHPELIQSIGQLMREVGRQIWTQLEPLIKEYKENPEWGRRGCDRGSRGKGGFWGEKSHHGWHGHHSGWNHRGGWGAHRGRHGGWGGSHQNQDWGSFWSSFWQAWQPGPTEDEKIVKLKEMGFAGFEDSYIRNVLRDRNGDVQEAINALAEEKEKLQSSTEKQ